MVSKKMVALLATAALVMTAFAALQPAVMGGPSGTVFTTNENGTRVTQNQYDDKKDVYLDGGPGPNAPQTAAGFDDGNYYFQVTGTDGRTLFSSDPVLCREVRTQGGVIVQYVSANRTYPVTGGARFCHLDGKDFGRHDTGTDSAHGAVTVQLTPFNNTSNQGGIYKLWLTSVDQFQGNASLVDNGVGNGSYHGFVASQSMTENFRVKTNTTFVAPTLTVRKFDDLDGDGTWDSGESEIGVGEKIGGGGWGVDVSDPNLLNSSGYTPYLYYTGYAGNYTASEEPLPGWFQSALVVDGTAQTVASTARVRVAYTDGETHEVAFGNFKSFVVSGSKVDDTNGNGQVDSGEGKLAGWKINLYRNGVLYKNTTTGSDGNFSFTVGSGGNYVVKEVNQDGWTQTGAANFSFAGKSGTDRTGLDFTNHRNGTSSTGSACSGLLCLTLSAPVGVSLDLNANALLGATVDLELAAATRGTVTVSPSTCTCATSDEDVDLLAALAASLSASLDTAAVVSSDTTAPCGCGNDTSAGLGLTVDVGADVGVGTSTPCGCNDTSAGVGVVVDVGADVGVGTSTPCGCESDTAVEVGVVVDVGADVGANTSAPCGCEQQAPPPQTTPPCGCEADTNASTGVSVDVGVGVEVGAASNASSETCTSSCGSTCTTACTSPCGCESNTTAATSADADVNASLGVGVDLGLGSCGCPTEVVVGADLGLDVVADVSGVVGLTL